MVPLVGRTVSRQCIVISGPMAGNVWYNPASFFACPFASVPGGGQAQKAKQMRDMGDVCPCLKESK